MKKIEYSALFLLGIGCTLIAGILIKGPGYMDAEYYAIGGIRLSEGYGFSENIIWNYLNSPTSIENPSHTYWMPLPSIIAFLGIWLFGNRCYLAMQSGFILLSGLIPVLAAYLSTQFDPNRKAGWIAGLISIFSGFAALYYSLTETFTLYLILGATITILLFRIESVAQKPYLKMLQWGVIGILSALMHMTRADGILWFATIFLIMIYRIIKNKDIAEWKSLTLYVAGYLLITFPWYYRNIYLFGTIFPSGNSRTLWIINYNQTFLLHVEKLTFTTWLSQGFPAIITTRFEALWMNIKNILAFQGMVILLPMMFIGVWVFWKDIRVRFSVLMFFITLGVMTIIFPFAGSRGGFIHSSAATQIVFWAIIPSGLTHIIKFFSRKRHWNPENAYRVFSTTLVVVMMISTVGIFFLRVSGIRPGEHLWTTHENQYARTFTELKKFGFRDHDVVMIKNPPGWFFVTRQPAIVIPDGDENNVLEAAAKFDATFLLLERDHVEGLDELFEAKTNTAGLEYINEFDGIQLYRISE